jgi:long-subunit acyl-CoA synthetase (AMP-forming)
MTNKVLKEIEQRSLSSKIELGQIIPNIATMLRENAERLNSKPAFQEKRNAGYEAISWSDFYRNICSIAYNLKKYGFQEGDKMVLFSPNRLEMLEMELALMASGGISVPIFAFYNQETAELLITHSDARYIAAAGEKQLADIRPDLDIERIFVFDQVDQKDFYNLTPFEELLKDYDDESFELKFDEAPDSICLNMYTSGTMGTPKCVQLSHKNILSQQAAMKALWDLDENDRFLSYLPWHHSFGGIFEKFGALCNGAVMSLESSYGKDANMIFENWELVKPTVFFSIPKIYKDLVSLAKKDKQAEDLLFHSGLKFIFTAAAPLPEALSDEFERREIPVIEGWGLTETSPCCTITDPNSKREKGVVGKPIPGISIRLGEEDEIQVKGPNIMKEYYHNDEANAKIFTKDGWFKTGDVGKIVESGVKLISRKDRIFKLLNGEKVIPVELEKVIENHCHYIQHAFVSGSGEDYPVALIFPKKNQLDTPEYDVSALEGCFCPRTIDEFGNCLRGCLKKANEEVGQNYSQIKAAMIIDEELSIENKTLTPSMKLVPKNIAGTFKVHLANLYGDDISVEQENYVIKLDENARINYVKRCIE